jgi:hypothetical protein
MSHFSTVRVQIKNGTVLHEALQDLGYKVACNTRVRGYQGLHTEAEYVIRQANGYDLGFRQAGDAYELVADFWGAGINETTFVKAVTQKYAHKMLLTTATAQGYSIETEEVLQDGTVRVVVGRWA